MSKKQDALVPLFGAVCFFLSAVEFVIPKPLPFFRIGLANVPLLLALDIFSFPAFLFLAGIKIVGQAIINGTLFSYVPLFSMTGTISAAIVMYGLHKIPKKLLSLAGISAAGAFAANAMQLILGRFFIFGAGITYLAPLLFCTGLITGVVLGVFCEKFIAESLWYNQIKQEPYMLRIVLSDKNSLTAHPLLRLIFGLSLLMMLFFTSWTSVRFVIFGAAIVLCIMEKQKMHLLPVVFSSTGIILCHLLVPSGKELFTVGSFRLITSGALLSGIDKAIVAAAMIYISRWTLQVPVRLPGKAGKTLREALYIFTQLFELKKYIKPHNMIASIDEILLSLPFVTPKSDNVRNLSV